MAYECASGAVAWRAGRGTGGYSSPQLATLGGVPQMLIVCDIGMQSFAPATGELFWEHLWKIQGYSRCVQPLVVHDDAVMLGTTGALGSRLLRVARAGAAWDVKEEWTTRKYRPYFNDGVLHKGCGYGFDGERLACLDVKTGARLWEGKLCGGQLLLVADMDLLLILSEAGEVLLVPATPEAFTEAARFKALDGKTWNHPVVADGCLFVRNSDEAACYELP